MPRVDSWGFAGFCCTVFSSTFLSATGTAGDAGCRRGQLFPAGLVRLLSRLLTQTRDVRSTSHSQPTRMHTDSSRALLGPGLPKLVLRPRIGHSFDGPLRA